MNIFQIIFKSRFLFFLFFLFISLPVLGIFLFNLTIQNIHDNVNSEIKQSVQVTAFEHQSWIERTNQFLELLSKVPEVTSGDKKSCSNFLSSMLELYPRYVNIALVGTDGVPLCSALPLNNKLNTNVWFEQTLKNKSFSVGEYQAGTPIQKAALSFGYPILDIKGDVKYVLYADLDLAWINELIGQINLPPQSTVEVIDDTGIILAEISNGEYVGKLDAEPLILQKILNEKTGTYDAIGVDGLERIYAFTSLGGNTFVIIGTPYSYIYAQISKISLPYLIIFFMTSLFLFGIFFKVWKR